MVEKNMKIGPFVYWMVILQCSLHVVSSPWVPYPEKAKELTEDEIKSFLRQLPTYYPQLHSNYRARSKTRSDDIDNRSLLKWPKEVIKFFLQNILSSNSKNPALIEENTHFPTELEYKTTTHEFTPIQEANYASEEAKHEGADQVDSNLQMNISVTDKSDSLTTTLANGEESKKPPHDFESARPTPDEKIYESTESNYKPMDENMTDKEVDTIKQENNETSLPIADWTDVNKNKTKLDATNRPIEDSQKPKTDEAYEPSIPTPLDMQDLCEKLRGTKYETLFCHKSVDTHTPTHIKIDKSTPQDSYNPMQEESTELTAKDIKSSTDVKPMVTDSDKSIFDDKIVPTTEPTGLDINETTGNPYKPIDEKITDPIDDKNVKIDAETNVSTVEDLHKPMEDSTNEPTEDTYKPIYDDNSKETHKPTQDVANELIEDTHKSTNEENSEPIEATHKPIIDNVNDPTEDTYVSVDTEFNVPPVEDFNKQTQNAVNESDENHTPIYVPPVDSTYTPAHDAYNEPNEDKHGLTNEETINLTSQDSYTLPPEERTELITKDTDAPGDKNTNAPTAEDTQIPMNIDTDELNEYIHLPTNEPKEEGQKPTHEYIKESVTENTHTYKETYKFDAVVELGISDIDKPKSEEAEDTQTQRHEEITTLVAEDAHDVTNENHKESITNPVAQPDKTQVIICLKLPGTVYETIFCPPEHKEHQITYTIPPNTFTQMLSYGTTDLTPNVEWAHTDKPVYKDINGLTNREINKPPYDHTPSLPYEESNMPTNSPSYRPTDEYFVRPSQAIINIPSIKDIHKPWHKHHPQHHHHHHHHNYHHHHHAHRPKYENSGSSSYEDGDSSSYEDGHSSSYEDNHKNYKNTHRRPCHSHHKSLNKHTQEQPYHKPPHELPYERGQKIPSNEHEQLDTTTYHEHSHESSYEHTTESPHKDNHETYEHSQKPTSHEHDHMPIPNAQDDKPSYEHMQEPPWYEHSHEYSQDSIYEETQEPHEVTQVSPDEYTHMTLYEHRPLRPENTIDQRFENSQVTRFEHTQSPPYEYASVQEIPAEPTREPPQEHTHELANNHDQEPPDVYTPTTPHELGHTEELPVDHTHETQQEPTHEITYEHTQKPPFGCGTDHTHEPPHEHNYKPPSLEQSYKESTEYNVPKPSHEHSLEPRYGYTQQPQQQYTQQPPYGYTQQPPQRYTHETYEESTQYSPKPSVEHVNEWTKQYGHTQQPPFYEHSFISIQNEHNKNPTYGHFTWSSHNKNPTHGHFTWSSHNKNKFNALQHTPKQCRKCLSWNLGPFFQKIWNPMFKHSFWNKRGLTRNINSRPQHKNIRMLPLLPCCQNLRNGGYNDYLYYNYY